jgi:hypothetical protein
VWAAGPEPMMATLACLGAMLGGVVERERWLCWRAVVRPMERGVLDLRRGWVKREKKVRADSLAVVMKRGGTVVGRDVDVRYLNRS